MYGMWFVFFFKQKTAYEVRISDWSSDVCSSDLLAVPGEQVGGGAGVLGDGELLDHLHQGVVEQDVVVGAGVPAVGHGAHQIGARSEERRVGKEGVSTCRSRGVPVH